MIVLRMLSFDENCFEQREMKLFILMTPFYGRRIVSIRTKNGKIIDKDRRPFINLIDMFLFSIGLSSEERKSLIRSDLPTLSLSQAHRDISFITALIVSKMMRRCLD